MSTHRYHVQIHITRDDLPGRVLRRMASGTIVVYNEQADADKAVNAFMAEAAFVVASTEGLVFGSVIVVDYHHARIGRYELIASEVPLMDPESIPCPGVPNKKRPQPTADHVLVDNRPAGAG